MEQRLRVFVASRVKQTQLKVLHVLQRCRVALELWKIIPDANVPYLILEQVHFVEEQNYRDVSERLVVDDRLEYAARFDEPIRLSVLEQHLIELARRREEDDRRHRLETLVPLLALRPLASDVDESERDVLDDELVFRDALCRFARVQNVERRRNVVLQHQHTTRVKITSKSNWKSTIPLRVYLVLDPRAFVDFTSTPSV